MLHRFNICTEIYETCLLFNSENLVCSIDIKYLEEWNDRVTGHGQFVVGAGTEMIAGKQAVRSCGTIFRKYPML